MKVHFQKINIDTVDPIQYKLKYESSTQFRYSLSGTVAVVGTPEFYAGTCFITLTGTGTLEIFGYKLIESESKIIKVIPATTGHMLRK